MKEKVGKKIKATIVCLELVSSGHRKALPLNHGDEAKKSAVHFVLALFFQGSSDYTGTLNVPVHSLL